VKAAAQLANPKTGGWVVDEFVGKTHPELFLPVEVFRELINLTVAGPPSICQAMREGFTSEVRGHELPPDFWERLQSISAPYAADLLAERELRASVQQHSGRARQRAQAAIAQKRNDVCRSRADALAMARSEFGRDRFDRFLYEAIAVNMFHSADRPDDPEVLRRMEGGCR